MIVWALGRFVFGLEGQHLLAIVIMGGAAHRPECVPLRLPLRARRDVARDVILCTTLLCAGALLVVAWLLG